MTWSIESAFVRAYSAVAVAVQGVLDFGAGVEQLTRPPRRPFADNDPDGGAQLAEREAERECWEPGELVPPPKTADDVCDRLDDIRNLLGFNSSPDSPVAGVRAAGSSPSEVSGATPTASPSEGCTGPSSTNGSAECLDGEAGAPDSGIHPPPGAPDLTAWLEPAVMTVLDDHQPHLCLGTEELLNCGAHPGYYRDWQAWFEHVAPLMSQHIAKAVEADWLPQHTKPSK